MPPLPQDDLDHILHHTAPLWPELAHQRLFLTGGTGFFGTWLTESFLHINAALNLNARITILTRNPEAFARKAPHLTHDPDLTLLQGDVRDFHFPQQKHTHIIHAATEASAQQLAEHPHQMLSTLLAGTERTLNFAFHTGASKLLLTSSGAVYGTQTIPLMPETHTGAPDPLLPSSVYGEGKRASELMCSLSASEKFEIKIARCYAFLGPHLPLDTHFAAGNFLRDALAGRPIHIASDGLAVRSYLYASDLTIALWTMLFRAPSLRAFNIGSEHAVTIRELAELTAVTVPLENDKQTTVTVAGTPDPNRPPHRYVPSTERARQELGLTQTVTLEQALIKTAAWHRQPK